MKLTFTWPIWWAGTRFTRTYSLRITEKSRKGKFATTSLTICQSISIRSSLFTSFQQCFWRCRTSIKTHSTKDIRSSAESFGSSASTTTRSRITPSRNPWESWFMQLRRSSERGIGRSAGSGSSRCPCGPNLQTTNRLWTWLNRRCKNKPWNATFFRLEMLSQTSHYNTWELGSSCPSRSSDK